MISERLKTIANCVSPYRHMIDVGTDHCFVPIYLAEKGLIEDAIGTDVRIGPIEEARKNVEASGLGNKIEVRMGNGLEPITSSDKCDCIVVSGMGGRLIADILDTGKHILDLNIRLVLQPNIDEDFVRKWLCENHYEIVNELILEESQTFYEIIVASKVQNKVSLSDLELKYGPILLKEKTEVFKKKYQQLLKTKKSVFLKVPEYHENKQIIHQEITEIESFL